MQDSRARPIGSTGTVGVFRYLDAATRPSLFRNGEVLTRRDAEGSDHGFRGVNLEPRELAVSDGRALPVHERRTLAANGFELVECPLGAGGPDFFDHDEVVRGYYPHCAALVSAKVGAEAFPFDHNVRSASGKQSRKRCLVFDKRGIGDNRLHGFILGQSVSLHVHDGPAPREDRFLMNILASGFLGVFLMPRDLELHQTNG